MKINKYKVLAALVRSFFDAFTSGIIDNSSAGKAESRKPKNFKETMLNHYEHIAPVFFDTIFFPLAAMNFKYEDIEKVVRAAQKHGDDMMSLVKTACASDALYEAMVAEYKRNFACLLGGRCELVSEHLGNYTQPEAGYADSVEDSRAVELSVRVVMFAYARGLRRSASGSKAAFNQATLFRLLLDAMNVLLLDAAADFKDCGEDLAAMFHKVCLTEHNFAVMTSEMDRTYEELVHREEICADEE